MQGARIIVVTQRPDSPQAWCSRDDWYTGHDSIYALLAKFARLNSMTARELADLFISRECGRRTAILRAPDVDLRSSELFDRAAFARHLRLDDAVVSNAFVLERLVNRVRRSSPVLRWCPQCAKGGFHTPAFQLELMGACPVHGQMLRSRCPRCRCEIPYALRTSVFEMPFCCPSCAFDLAPCLRETRARALRFRPDELAWIDHMMGLFEFEDRMIPLKLELNRRRKALGLGEFSIVPADWQQMKADYTGFVKHVLEFLEPKPPGAQLRIDLNEVSVATKRAWRASTLPAKSRKLKKIGRDITPDQRTSTHVKQQWDAKLLASYAVYSAVRRYLWRHVVRGHRHCIASTANHLWWHMEGESTVMICPVAEAFVRWRMHWEYCGTPRYLMAPMGKDPMGLVSWLSSEAPICPAGWNRESEQWVSDQLLGARCFDSFQAFVDVALKSRRRKKIKWERDANFGTCVRYWAVTGRDRLGAPTQLFQRVRAAHDFPALIDQQASGRAHRAVHAQQLSQIVR
jgi:hypothetical protein